MQLTQTRTGEVTIVRPQGRIDSITAPAFQETIRGLIDAGAHRLAIDLADVTYISTAGLRALLMIARALETARGRLALCGLSHELLKLFELSQFNTLLRIVPTEPDAIAALR
jgi:anti-sigma B factor antagonist